MACEIKTSSSYFEAAYAEWGGEELTKVVPVTGLVGGESFKISTPTVDYQVWFSVNAVGTAPTPSAGETLVEVSLPSAYTVAQACALIKSTIEALKKQYVHISDNNDCVLFENLAVGQALTTASDIDTLFTITVLKAGFVVDLGKTADGIEMTTQANVKQIKANQTGDLTLDELVTGVSVSVSMNLIELGKAKLEKVIGNGFGATFTPVGGTSIVGFGTSKNFTSSFQYAGRLTLKPVRKGAVRDEDAVIWKCIPSTESVNYDGENIQTLAITFNALVDERKPAEISIAALSSDCAQYLG